MANYTLHLGYHWNGPLIGALWSATPTAYRYLTYALADASGNPAWFQFQPDDNLYVRLWDLSPPRAPHPSAWVLDMSLGSLTSAATYDPTAYLNLNGCATVNPQPPPNGSASSYFQLGTLSVSYGSSSGCPWGAARGSSAPVGPITFLLDLQCELSFGLEVTAVIDGDRISQIFVSDPETRIGGGVNT